MFKQVKSPAYGTGIASNLVSSEERQRYNYGGRVRAVDGLFTRADAIKEAEREVWGSPFAQDVQVGVLGAKDFMEDYMIHPAAQGGKHALNYLIGTDFDTSGDLTRDSDSYGKVFDEYVAPRAKRIWKEKGEEGLTQQHPREMLEESVKVDDMSDIIDVGGAGGVPEEQRHKSIFEEKINEELDPGADLKGTPKEDPIVKLLRENEERAKKRGKVAALAQGVSMASHLLDKPFSKAVAAAGKEAPMLAKAYSDEVKSAEGLPLQWDMIKEKIQLEGEQAIEKAKVGEERKAAYQAGYLNYLNASLAEAARNPDSTVTSLFDAKTNKSLSLTANDQVNVLAEIASKKGKVLDIQVVDISDKKNYKNVRKGTIVRDSKTAGHWYVMDEDGVLSKPTSVLDITTDIDKMPMVTKP